MMTQASVSICSIFVESGVVPDSAVMACLLRVPISHGRPNQKNPANRTLAAPTATPVTPSKMRSNTINSASPRLAMKGSRPHPARTDIARSRRSVD
jgi:hypothetical protein